jgi:hypothetical protein
MFSFGEYVRHRNTGHIGQVIGYKRQFHPDSDNASIVKVLVSYAENSGKRGIVEEDLHSAWSRWQ